jgi:hypothetical protein
MIFKQHFIDLILSGKKTQTRRPNRGYYVEGKTYAIQPCRTCPGLCDYRIEIDHIWEEDCRYRVLGISCGDAWAEGLYHRLDFELLFIKLYPKWDGKKRWAFKFHVVEVTNENT